VDEIKPNGFQPRQQFDPEALTELARSLKLNGLLQPISVRTDANGGYELIAGERRLRAAKRLGWATIPALVRDEDDRQSLVLALVENLQRHDLNPLDEAHGYQRLMNEFGLTQQHVADSVGKDRSTVANLLRVLALPQGVRALLRDGSITLGHARALLAFPDDRSIVDAAKQIIEHQLSVRDIERMAQEQRLPSKATKTPAGAKSESPASESNAQVRHLTEVIRRHLQTDVSLKADASGKGEMVVRFYSHDDLQRVLERMLGRSLDALA
jgi:ParB family chromosome partitioning protein